MKKIGLNAKNLAKLDDWVESREIPVADEAIKKLTVIIPAALHKEFKQKVLAKDGNMREVVEQLIRNWCENPNLPS